MSIPLFTTKYHPCPATPVGLGRQISVVISVLSAVIFLSFAFNVNAGSVINKAPTSLGLITGLVGYWSFDGPDMAGVTAFDRSGQGNNGTLTNGPVRGAGRIGQALEFDGVNDFVNTGTNNLAGATSISVAEWIFAGSSDFDGTLKVMLDDSGSSPFANNGTFFILDDRGGAAIDGINFAVDTATGDGVDRTAGNVIKERRWYHVVGTYDGATSVMQIYVDGRVVSTVAGSGTGSGNFVPRANANLTINSWNGSGSELRSITDDVRIYNRALSSDEIKRLYNMGR